MFNIRTLIIRILPITVGALHEDAPDAFYPRPSYDPRQASHDTKASIPGYTSFQEYILLLQCDDPTSLDGIPVVSLVFTLRDLFLSGVTFIPKLSGLTR